ncbi:hypothetical protein DNU06_09615 [Putridiphycobacter roseus]|uniref:VanZ-like domain-containing protein n=1 Tax=Putridiphycobacter roseus TaxID=2219161 RepID=A0A2W1MYP7_9FLAO|nr:VanZ family protein [Putridiphycobacter roseus]PZE16997.1 hypothetical protein DNU06_09615 [Putridiphycobacter roseus]
MAKSNLTHLPWVIWLVVISFLSLLPGDRLPEIKFEWFKIDTMVHIIMYTVLSFLMLFGFCFKKNEPFRRKALYIVVVCIIFGFGIEIIQGSLIRNRFFSWKDFIANNLGVFTGMLIYYYYNKKEITW